VSAAPRVSFVVPCYNYGRFLSQAIDSLLSQSVQDLEVIVVDDASSDETGEVIAAYASSARVRAIRHERNLGHLRSYNDGLAIAQGAYVGLLSADDYSLERDAVARQVEVFERNPSVGLVYGGHLLVEADGTVTTVLPFAHDRVRDGREEFADLQWGNYITHSGTLLRADLVRELGPYDPRLPHTGDWDMWLRAAALRDVAYVAAPLYAYRMHRKNMRHRSISPAAAASESLLTLERGYEALPAAAAVRLRRDREGAMGHALLQNAWFDLHVGMRGRAFAALLYALRRRPGILGMGETWRLVARILTLAAVGHERYRRLSSWRETRRSASTESQPGTHAAGRLGSGN
jgi:glycosyltransferase involved in cell wall biosynthesis